MSKRTKLWGGLAAILIMIAGVVVWQIQQPESSAQPVDADKDIFEVRDDDWTKGNPDADVIVIKFSDFGCPACLNYAAMDYQLAQQEELGDSVLFVYRHFPLQNSQASKMAARYTEAAGRQGKFWEMHDLIFNNQQNWKRGNAIMMLRQMAEHLGLDMEQINEDVMDPAIEQKINRQYNQGVEAGVSGVPAVYINGQKMSYTPDMEEYRANIESYLEAE